MNTLWSMTIPAGGKWSASIRRGKLLRFTSLGDGANASLLLYNAEDLAERYNMPDTLKAQHTSHLTRGHVLMSDNGRAMASFVADTVGWHDPIAGYSTRASTDEKYGVTRYQEQRNDWLRSGQENFTMELVRNGLGTKDLVPPVNLFAKVSSDEDGDMHFQAGHSRAGDSVSLRTEMDILLLVSNTPNPLDARTEYPSVPVRLDVLPAAPVDMDDACVTHCPETKRAFENTWAYYALLAK